MTEIKTTEPDIAIKIIQRKDRKEKDFFLIERWVTCEKISSGLT